MCSGRPLEDHVGLVGDVNLRFACIEHADAHLRPATGDEALAGAFGEIERRRLTRSGW
jgi:hypothetical protein